MNLLDGKSYCTNSTERAETVLVLTKKHLAMSSFYFHVTSYTVCVFLTHRPLHMLIYMFAILKA